MLSEKCYVRVTLYNTRDQSWSNNWQTLSTLLVVLESIWQSSTSLEIWSARAPRLVPLQRDPPDIEENKQPVLVSITIAVVTASLQWEAAMSCEFACLLPSQSTCTDYCRPHDSSQGEGPNHLSITVVVPITDWPHTHITCTKLGCPWRSPTWTAQPRL